MIDVQNMKKIINQCVGTDKEGLLVEILKNSAVLTSKTPAIQQIKRAQDIINRGCFDSSVYYDKPYLLTTRNQQYVDHLLPQDADSAFVILSSGDTIFQLVSRGINKIVTVDVNDLQPFVFKLRKASIEALTPTEFEGFLVDSKCYRFMSQDLYKKVRPFLNGDDIEALSFWDNLLKINSQDDFVKYFFKGIGGDLLKVRASVPYLKKKGIYFSLREKLKKVQITIELEEALTYLQSHPDKKFDYIDITNILLFLYQIQCDNDVKRFNEVLKILRVIYENNLNNGGIMVIDYLFGVGLNSLGNITEQDHDKRLVQEIYKYTYLKLKELFELESYSVGKLIDGFGDESDTVLYVKK